MAQKNPPGFISDEEMDAMDDHDLPEGYISDEEMEAGNGPSRGDSFLKGAQQGTTFGFADELGGKVQQGMDSLYGLFGESPTEINARLEAEGTTGDIGPTSSSDLYKQARDENRQMYKEAEQAHSGMYTGGAITGGVLTSMVPGLGVAKNAKLLKNVANATLQGGAFGAGASEDENMGGIARDAMLGGATGALAGTFGYGLGKSIEKGARGIGNLIKRSADPLENMAENLAVKATGATGKQASEFADDTGRELLDRGLVKFGDSPSQVASRVGSAVDEAGDVMGTTLKMMEKQGIKANAGNVIAELEKKAMELGKDPSQTGVVRKLLSIIDDIKATSGSGDLALTEAEGIKRGFNKMAGNWVDQDVGQAGKSAYGAFKNEVERAGEKGSGLLSTIFKDAKKTFGKLSPVREAAEKRASTLNQSPIGGLLDTASAGAGAISGGPVGGVTTAVGRRLIAPRLASTGAVTADWLSKIATQAPQSLGKFAGVFQTAAQRGPQAVAAAHFVLQQSNPEYQQTIRTLAEDPDLHDE